MTCLHDCQRLLLRLTEVVYQPKQQATGLHRYLPYVGMVALQGCTMPFYLVESVVRIIVVDDHPDQIEQRGRMYPFPTRVPCSQLMTQETACSMQAFSQHLLAC